MYYKLYCEIIPTPIGNT